MVADKVLHNAAEAIGLLSAFNHNWTVQLEARNLLLNSNLSAQNLRNLVLPRDEQLLLIAAVWPNEARGFAVGRDAIIKLIDKLDLYEVMGSKSRFALTEGKSILSEAATAEGLLRDAYLGMRPDAKFVGRIHKVPTE